MNEPRGSIGMTYEAWRGALDPDMDEALNGGTCICGQVLDMDALRCDTCGQCVWCGGMSGKADDPECEPCTEFLHQEQQAAHAS